jgi:ribosomal protein L37E
MGELENMMAERSTCEYCQQYSMADERGGCVACGAPKKKLDRVRYYAGFGGTAIDVHMMSGSIWPGWRP